MDAIVVLHTKSTHVQLDDQGLSPCKIRVTCTIGEVTVLRIYFSMIMVIKMLNRRSTVNICQRMEGRGGHARRGDAIEERKLQQ